MNIIAHRGLLEGPNHNNENNPEQILYAIKNGFDAEIDLRCINNELWLGHDEPQYKINLNWLTNHCNNLWIHCKNLEAMEFCFNYPILNYFSHDLDNYVITSKGYVWAYPGMPGGKFTILVMPEYKNMLESIIEDFNMNKIAPYGICTDFSVKVRNETKRNNSW